MNHTSKKRIGIDARFYGAAGIGRYISCLLKELETDEVHEYFVFLNQTGFDFFNPTNKNFHKVLCDIPWYSWKEQLVLPFVFGRYHLDLLHIPHFNIPIFYFGKIVVTIHDLIINDFSTERATTLSRPYYRFKRLVYSWLVKTAVARSSKVIVPSNYTKQVVQQTYAVSESKIIVTYEGLTKNIHGGHPLFSGMPYLLFVGSMYPHKNLERLIEVFVTLRRNGTFSGDLVLAGKSDYFSQRLQAEVYVKYPDMTAQDIIFPISKYPRLPLQDDELAELYQNAVAFVFPSLSEGFGLPPLEAMGIGCPVVSSNSTSIPEICGDAALYFDPLDASDMAAKISKIISDPVLRSELVEKGRKNIERFSWSKMAGETLKVYEDCLSSR
ncbi:MAG: glycosyltransferase family 1 protein [candidate division WWE3 bacterium]|nr:glycosyltransferase family 1 protein [candidate division WWE3 bacterium]